MFVVSWKNWLKKGLLHARVYYIRAGTNGQFWIRPESLTKIMVKKAATTTTTTTKKEYCYN